MIWIIILAIFLVYVLSGIRIIKDNNAGVIISLGRITRVLRPGIGWILPFFERIEYLNTKIKTHNLPEELMITKDLDEFKVKSSFTYFIEHPDRSLKVEDIDETTKNISCAIIKSKIGEVETQSLISKREETLQKTLNSINTNLSIYGTKVNSVNIHDLKPVRKIKKAKTKNEIKKIKEKHDNTLKKAKEEIKETTLEEDDFLLD
ncbi:MAG: SPFH domain-containing protein [Candidatus Woesearchaeota archaeon]